MAAIVVLVHTFGFLLLARVGLVAFIAMTFVTYVLPSFPFTLQINAWHFAVGLGGVLVVSALGATTSRAIRNVAWSGIGLAAIGAGAGLMLAWPVTQALDNRGFLWGVGSHDPATFIAGAGFLLLVAAVASVVPALKILRLDPAQALRE